MAKRESVWSWVTDKVQGITQRRVDARGVDMPEEENPWFSLHTRSSEPSAVSREYTRSSGTSDSARSPRWLSEDGSPYGFSDDDGTLKQVESHTWRQAVEGKKPKRFVATSTAPTSRWQPGTTGTGQKRAVPSGSTWMFQSICAILLVAGALYAHQSQGPVAARVQTVFQDMFEHDYAQTTMPAVQQFLDNHHISLPALGSLGAVRLHPPLDGKVVTDYSTTHPEMVIEGTSGEVVTAAGSGTVVKVAKLSTGMMVRIDHGTAGSTTYIGLADTSIREQAYVTSGQVIGHLPKTSHPQLEFTLEKQGHYVDPHDDIQFASSGV